MDPFKNKGCGNCQHDKDYICMAPNLASMNPEQKALFWSEGLCPLWATKEVETMAKLDAKVSVAVEPVVHSTLREALNEIKEKYGIAVERIEVAWFYPNMRTPAKVDSLTIQTRTEAREKT